MNRAPFAGALLFAALSTQTAAPAAAQEQPDTFRLREIVVTATRLPTDIASAPGAVTVISGAELKARGIRYVADAMRLVPGVAVARTGGPGGLTSVFMRGGEADYVQVLIDGVQANEPGGTFNWAHLRADDIDRIEVVRGPASVLYGSDAVSGVVQIFTRGGGAPRIEVGATGGRGSKTGAGGDGTYRTDAFDAGISGSTRDLARNAVVRYGLTFAHHLSNGLYEFNSDYDNTAVNAKLGIAMAGADVGVSVRRGTSEFHYPTSGGGTVVDPNQFATSRTVSVGVDAGARILPALELRVLATSHDAASRTDDPADDEQDGTFWSTNDVNRRAVDLRANAYLPRGLVFTVGAAYQRQHGETAYESVSGFGTFGEETDDRRDNTGYYAQLHGPVGDRVALTLGARIDDNETFGTFTTGRAAASFQPVAGTRLRAAIGTAFKEPSFYENFATGFVTGNPDLQPERSFSWEVGAERTVLAGRLTIGATWFDQRFTDMIQYTATPPAQGAPNYHNVAGATARGLELTAAGRVDGVTVDAGWTFTRTRVTDAGFDGDRAFEDGMPLLRRPEHQASLRASGRIVDALRAHGTLLYTGTRDDLDFTDPVEWQGIRTALPAYTTLDLGLEHGILRSGNGTIDVSFTVRNVFDTRYADIFNFPAPGRVLQLGIRASR